MKRFILPLIIATVSMVSLTCTSCGKKKPPPPPPVVVQAPDYEPIAEGWKVQSYALIGIAVIVAIVVIGKSKND